MRKLVQALKHRLFGKDQGDIDRLRADSLTGENLERIVTSGDFEILCKEILDPMADEAYVTFKKVDPSDFNSVCQAQKLGQIIDEIKKRLERKIELGRSSRKRLIELITDEVTSV